MSLCPTFFNDYFPSVETVARSDSILSDVKYKRAQVLTVNATEYVKWNKLT